MKFYSSLIETLSSVAIFKTHKFRFQHEKWQGGQTEEFERVVFDRGNSVHVLMFDRHTKEIILVEQFRPGVAANPDGDNPWVIEPVAGSMDVENEHPEVTARREIEEEAPGCEIINISPLPSVYLSPGACSEKAWLFYAIIDSSEAREYGGLKDHQEDIRLRRFPIADIHQAIQDGTINTATTVILIQNFLINEFMAKELFNM